ncbi:pleckstrin homology domain-containing family M member 1-like isoform X2 [Halichondria panicea]|uniref:pleckstrin homology domain-containing family M member 1-like isoform X2 n=1 Tax=Halichondria panicea TaxID=6063 RepID=UPI00312B6D24
MDPKKGQLGSPKNLRKLLCEELAGSVKRVQELFVRTKQIECGNSTAELLCDVVEAIFLHELKNSRGQVWREIKRPNPNIPPDPLLVLRNSESDVRKCRSWVRLVLVKGLLLSFMLDLLRHPGLLASHYGGEAVLRHLESTEIIVGHLRGLSIVQLEYDYATPHLDSWDPTALHIAGLWTPPRSIRERTVSGNKSPAKESLSPQSKKTPPKEFNVEGVSIINLALDKYSEKKARTEKFTDSELITKELDHQQLTPPTLRPPTNTTPPTTRPPTDSMSEAEASTRSYSAMLHSYARKTSYNGPGSDAMLEGTPPEGGSVEGVQREGGYSLALSMDFEIVTPDGDLVEPEGVEQFHKHLTVLTKEQGMDRQNYQCVGCNGQIGLIFGQSRLCKYNGQHYCFDCHHDDERVIPARVLFNWDFRKHKVCVGSGEYLDRIQHTKQLDLEKVNKALYLYIPEIEEARRLRLQCHLLTGFVLTCKDTEIGVQFKKRLRHSYIYENIHQYCMQDLLEVHSGVLGERLRKVVRMGMKHVKQCMLCSQRGFICEVCQSDDVIYPFDIDNTHQCGTCNALFHQSCQPAKGNCPKCYRVRKRKVNSNLEGEDILIAN